jgi:hypothetical protein
MGWLHVPSIDEYAAELKRRGRITEVTKEAIAKARTVTCEYKNILYVAGPLTGMSEEVKERYGRISDVVARVPGWFGYVPHLHGTDPIAHPDVSADEVRDVDFLWSTVVATAQVNCLFPVAHGNGIEEGWAELAEIPTLYLVPASFMPSRLVRGMWNVGRTVSYDNFDDCLFEVYRFVAELPV